MKKTKIICSIGPASNEVDVMKQMVLAGMNVARVNFSHATLEERFKAIESARKVRELTGCNVAILWDTKGPEFRSGMLKDGEITLTEGKTIRIVKKDILGTEEEFTVNHPEAIDGISVGNIVFLENAKMKLEVISKEEDGITCKIINGGVLGNKKSMSVPGVKLNIPYISDEDREDIKFACENGGEYLALSFVSSKEDVLEVKKLLKEYKREDLQLICKIESALGVENVKSILEVSDGIMVARGDMGNEIPSARIPLIQKDLIKICRNCGKIAIVATEMLETMMNNNRPKRAETSDIANAVLDGTDAIMLSGETTVGKHPIETVAAMADICETVEKYAKFNYITEVSDIDDIPTAIATSVVTSSDILHSKLICAATISGRTAKLISNMKPESPVLALVPTAKDGRRLTLNWGVYPAVLPVCNSTDEVLTKSVEMAKKFMDLKKKETIIITGSFPNNQESRPTDLMKIQEI